METKTFLSIYYCIKSSCLRPFKAYIILSILMSLMVGSSCEILNDEEADKKCEASKLNPTDVKINIKCQFAFDDKGPSLNPTYRILDALDLQFIGTIRKIDCRGYEVSYFDIDSTIYPSFLFPKPSVGYTGFVEVSPYDFPFKITNSEEYFTVSLTMKATFKDGKVLQSTQVSNKTKLADLLKLFTDSYTIGIVLSNVYWSVATK